MYTFLGQILNLKVHLFEEGVSRYESRSMTTTNKKVMIYVLTHLYDRIGTTPYMIVGQRRKQTKSNDDTFLLIELLMRVRNDRNKRKVMMRHLYDRICTIPHMLGCGPCMQLHSTRWFWILMLVVWASQELLSHVFMLSLASLCLVLLGILKKADVSYKLSVVSGELWESRKLFGWINCETVISIEIVYNIPMNLRDCLFANLV
jgi:hypothetical protein